MQTSLGFQNCVKYIYIHEKILYKEYCKNFILILWRKLSFSEKSSNMENVGFVKCELKEDMDEEEFVNYDNKNNEENCYSCNKCEEVYFTKESLKQHLIEVHDTETHKGTVTRSIYY